MNTEIRTPIIEARQLSRWYGIVMGLNNVTFEIHSGITGLVGPNGAGKSTLIQMITGQLQPSSGQLLVFGESPWNRPETLKKIGYCPEKESLPKDLKPLPWLTSLGLISGIHPSEVKDRAVALLRRVQLKEEHWKKRMGQFSKGMKQRVKLAQALIHQPRLLVLDEPMNGLDPMGRQEIANLMNSLKEEGTSILVSSHILHELETLCREILILSWGRVLASGSQKDIRTDMSQWSEQLNVRCSDPSSLVGKMLEDDALLGYLQDPDQPELVTLWIRDPSVFYTKWLEYVLASGVQLKEARSQSLSLNQLFDKVTS